jgi:hypothetical protein
MSLLKLSVLAVAAGLALIVIFAARGGANARRLDQTDKDKSDD